MVHPAERAAIAVGEETEGPCPATSVRSTVRSGRLISTCWPSSSAVRAGLAGTGQGGDKERALSHDFGYRVGVAGTDPHGLHGGRDD